MTGCARVVPMSKCPAMARMRHEFRRPTELPDEHEPAAPLGAQAIRRNACLPLIP